MPISLRALARADLADVEPIKAVRQAVIGADASSADQRAFCRRRHGSPTDPRAWRNPDQRAEGKSLLLILSHLAAEGGGSLVQPQQRSYAASEGSRDVGIRN